MKINKFYIFIISFSALLFSVGCSTTKYLKPDQFLLKKVHISCNSSKIEKADLYNAIRQKPNRKILGIIPLHLWIYNSYKQDKKSRFKARAGEPPVIYDKYSTQESVEQLKKYLNNKGFFDSEVSVKVKQYIKRKKITVDYIVKAKKPFEINTIFTKSDVSAFESLLNSNKFNFNDLKGKNFDIDMLDNLRENIAEKFKNVGYYHFKKTDITFLADSTVGDKKINLTIIANRNKDSLNQRTLSAPNDRIYYINNIYIRENYTIGSDGYDSETDTINYKNLAYFIQDTKPKVKYKTLAHCLFIGKGNKYSFKKYQLTYRRLNALGIFNYINMQFYPTPGKGNDSLDCIINLAKSKSNSFIMEGEGKNNGGYLGTSGDVSFQNNNIFHGAEKLNIKFKGGIEIQPLNINKDKAKIIHNLPFNTLEYGPEISIDFPRFLLPVGLARFSKRENPHTKINLAYNYQFRPDYDRKLASATFAYSWNETKYKQHIITPIALNLIKIHPSAAFTELLAELDDPFLFNSYQDHLILATQYSFIFNNKQKQSLKHSFYFRFNAETGGNLLNFYSSANREPTDSGGTYQIFGIRFAQYVRSDIDLRYYKPFKHSEFVSRFVVGLGVPYGNSTALPYSKSFYAGGSNDIRAWRVRTLGPGSMNDSLLSSRVDQMGEVQLETNFEYRFDITKVVKGAFFVDAGNIWLLKKNIEKPDAEFQPGRLWQDIAIGTGFGIRLDFSYFLLRFDLGVPIKDPGSDYPKRIKPDFSAPPLNIGIGYPF